MNEEANTGASTPVPRLRAIYKKLEKELEETRDQPTLEQRKQQIMNLLHEFNDVKDAAQIVIGALANVDGKTIKEMHMHYNLPTIE